LNVVPLRLPPLRERIEDLPDLIGFFTLAEKDGLRRKKLDAWAERMSSIAGRAMCADSKNLARGRGFVSARRDHRLCHRCELAPPAVTSAAASNVSTISAAPSKPIFHRIFSVSLTGYRRRPLSPYPQGNRGAPADGALAATEGNQIRAADLLGLNRNTLRKKIRDLDIQVLPKRH